MKKIDTFEKILLGILITLILYTKNIAERGYLNPGGELVFVPMILIFKYLIKETKAILTMEEEIEE